MNIHRWSILGSALLALLSADAVAASSAAPHVAAGETRLALSPDAASTIPIDIQALAEHLCGPAFGKAAGPEGKCHLTTPPGPGKEELRLRIPHSPVEGAPLWQAAGLDLSGEPVQTSCGTWSFALSLDDTRSQPLSPMILTPSSKTTERRLFASVVEMRARLHLANLTTGQSVDYPLVLGLGLAGSLSPAPGDEAGAGARGKSLRRILIGKDDDPADDPEECLPLWVEDYPDLLKEYLALGCEVCLCDDCSEP